jgi:hypothetical protein
MQNGKFNPNKSATREEVAWMLVGACKTVQIDGFDINKKADLTKFKDKPSAWASGRMAIAVGNGFIGGYTDKTIRPKATITRAELAVLLSRLIKEDTPPGFLPFDDYIPNWAMDGIKKAYGKNIIKGYSGGNFNANSGVTKAEALVMIQRWKDTQPKAILTPSWLKDINEKIKNTVIKDGIIIYYADGKPRSAYDSGDFRLYETKNAYELVVYSYRHQPTMDGVKKVLEYFYPKQYEKANSSLLETCSTKTNVKTNYDNKTFESRWALKYISVIISK